MGQRPRDCVGLSDFTVCTIKDVAQPYYCPIDERDIGPTLVAFHSWWEVFATAIGCTFLDLEVFSKTFYGETWTPEYEESQQTDHFTRISHCVKLLQDMFPRLTKGMPPVPIPVKILADTITEEVLEKRVRGTMAAAALRMHGKRLIVNESKLAGSTP